MEKEFYTEEHAALRPIMLWRVTRSLAEKRLWNISKNIMYRDLSCGNVLWRVTHISADEQAVVMEFCIEEHAALRPIMLWRVKRSFSEKRLKYFEKYYVQRPLLRQCALACYAYYSRRTSCWKRILHWRIFCTTVYYTSVCSGELHVLWPQKRLRNTSKILCTDLSCVSALWRVTLIAAEEVSK